MPYDVPFFGRNAFVEVLSIESFEIGLECEHSNDKIFERADFV
jgi:hypothetical protein